MQRRDKRDSNVSWSASERRVTKRTVAYRPAVSIRLSRSLGFPTCLFLASPLSGPHERRPMASRNEQLSSLFFVAWTTQPLHEKLLMGFRRAKFTQRNTNHQKNIFVDDRFRGHHPRCNGNPVGVGGQRGDRKIQGRQKMCRDRGSNSGLRN